MDGFLFSPREIRNFFRQFFLVASAMPRTNPAGSHQVLRTKKPVDRNLRVLAQKAGLSSPYGLDGFGYASHEPGGFSPTLPHQKTRRQKSTGFGAEGGIRTRATVFQYYSLSRGAP